MKRLSLIFASFKDFVATPPWIGFPINYDFMLTGHVQHQNPEVAALGNIIAEKLGIDTDLVMACIPVMLDNLVLMNKKQHDYGPHNLTKFGTFGVVVRANDKLERLITLTRPGAVARVDDEGIADTLRDLSNYGMIGYVIEKKLWPTK